MTDPRTLAEAYTRATQSSDLTPSPERRVDVDYAIAAGVVRESLGTKLYRLASEWDLASGSYRIALHHAHQVDMQAMQIQRNARRFPAEAAVLMGQAERLLKQSRDEALTAKVLAMVHLKTLHETALELGAFACVHATKTRFMEPDTAVRKLAGKALNLWLDGNCQACSGRKYNGGHLTPMVLCTECGATGKAHFSLSRREPEAAFILALLAQMDLKVDTVDRQMRRWLVQNGPKAKADPCAEQALGKRLAELRSTEAERD